MSTVNFDSLNRLNTYIKDNVLTGFDRYRDYRMKCTGFKYSDDLDNDDKIITTFHVLVSEVQYELLDEWAINPKSGDKYQKKNYDKFKILRTDEHNVDLVYPKGDMGLVADKSTTKRKTNINSARYSELIKFTKYSIIIKLLNRSNGYYAKLMMKMYKKDTKDKTKVPLFLVTIGHDITISLADLLAHFGLLNDSKWMKYYGSDKQYSDYIDIASSGGDLNPEIVDAINEYKVDPKVLDKFEILTEGTFKPTSDSIDKNLVDFLCAQYLIDADNQDELGKNRHCEIYNMRTPLDFVFMDSIDGVLYDISNSTKLEDYGGITTRTHLISDIYYNYARPINIPGTDIKQPSRRIHLNALQNLIDKYFRMQTDNFHNVQTTKDSNALTILSQARTIYFYEQWDQEENTQTAEWKQQRLYNKSFNGVLEPTRTTDSGLVNKKNEFALGTHVENNNIYIDVIDIRTDKVKALEYVDFCRQPILTRECYDEVNKKPIRSPYTNKYEILQYLNYKSYDELPEDVKYARSKLNELTYATAMIPATNRMVATRTMLGSRFLDQSVAVTGARPTVVHTAMPKYIYDKCDPERVEYDLDEDGVVEDIKDQLIKVRTKNGNVKIFGKSTPFVNTSQATTNEYKPVVKIGQKIKKGTILETSNAFVDGEFTTQVPLMVMFGTYKAWEHEDGILLTESAAKKFTHMTDMVLEESETQKSYISFKRNDYEDTNKKAEKVLVKGGRVNRPVLKTKTITHNDNEQLDNKFRKYNLDEWSLVKKGSLVTAGSLLFEYYKYDRDEIHNGFAEAFGGQILDSLTPEIKQIRVPYNVRGEGTITDVQLYVNDNKDFYNEGTKLDPDTVLNYKEIKKEPKDFEYPGPFGLDAKDNLTALKHFKDLGTEDALDKLHWKEEKKPRGQSLWTISDEDNLFELKVVVRYADEMTNERLAGKLSNFYASKGVNVHIIPDEYAPVVKGLYDEKGKEVKIEGIISSGTTYSRQNFGQLDECRLGLIGQQLWIKYVKPNNSPTKAIEKLLDNIYPPKNGVRSWDWKQLKADGQKYGYCRLQVDYFDNYYKNNKILEILNQMQLGNINGDFKIYLPEFKVTTEYYATVGITSMMRLHFIQEHKASITPDAKPIYNDSDNITYRDMINERGQKFGQMEMMAMAAHGEQKVLEKVVLQKNQTSKYSNMYSALIGMALKLN